eukprot:SAG31_NODE_377_length_16533_cov_99.867957_16_plen_65_part_00
MLLSNGDTYDIPEGQPEGITIRHNTYSLLIPVLLARDLAQRENLLVLNLNLNLVQLSMDILKHT